MPAKSVLVYLDAELLERVDRAREDTPRSRVVRRALEAWLSRNERRSKNLPQPPEDPPEDMVREGA